MMSSRSLLDSLSLTCTDAKEKERLASLAADMSQGNEYIKRQSGGVFSIMDILNEFKSIKIDVCDL